MPPTKRILKHVSVEKAGKKRKCHRNADHKIDGGKNSLAVYDDMGGRRNYCPACAKPILDQAQSDLDQMREGLGL
jgi:hypothetical protein